MSSGKRKTCANCGNEVREGARFCASCGAAVAPAAEEPSRAEPPPPPSPGGKRRLLWVAVGVAVALLVAGGAGAALLFAGGDDSSQAGADSITNTTDVLPTDDATTTEAEAAAGVDCEELTSLVDTYSGALAAGETDPIASAENLEAVTAALSAFASQAPEDVQQDFETIMDAYEEMARTVSDLGLEPGDIPDAEQQQEILELVANVFGDTEFLDASLNVAAWFETATAQC